jgi:hypothetical protein
MRSPVLVLAPILAPILGQLGPLLGQLGPLLGPLRPILGQLGPLLGPLLGASSMRSAPDR